MKHALVKIVPATPVSTNPAWILQIHPWNAKFENVHLCALEKFIVTTVSSIEGRTGLNRMCVTSEVGNLSTALEKGLCANPEKIQETFALDFTLTQMTWTS
jgi:hypothetical protein